MVKYNWKEENEKLNAKIDDLLNSPFSKQIILERVQERIIYL